MSHGYCNICGKSGNSMYYYPRLRWLAGVKGLTVADLANDKASPGSHQNNVAHYTCYRALERLAAVTPDKVKAS